MVDLEHPAALDARDPVGTAVEPRAEDDHLLDPVAQGLPQQIVDQPGPGDARRACAGPSVIDVSGHDPAHDRQARDRHYGTQRRPEKGGRERIVE